MNIRKKTGAAVLGVLCMAALAGCQNQQSQTTQTAEYIGIEAAKETALKSAGLTEDQADFSTAGLDSRDGTFFYQVNFEAEGMEYDYAIDAVTGVVIEENSVAADDGAEAAGAAASEAETSGAAADDGAEAVGAAASRDAAGDAASGAVQASGAAQASEAAQTSAAAQNASDLSAFEAAGVAITVMKPLGAGTLLSAERSPFGVAMTVPQCIQYCLDRNGVKVVIVGCHSVEEVLEAVRYEHLPAKERDYSHIFHTGAAIHMTGRCMYCNHCQPCPAHIDIAAVTKFLDLATQQETVPETVAQHYWSLSATADDCLMCGRCEPNCPFGVQIRKNMARAREVFAHTAPV